MTTDSHADTFVLVDADTFRLYDADTFYLWVDDTPGGSVPRTRPAGRATSRAREVSQIDAEARPDGSSHPNVGGPTIPL